MKLRRLIEQYVAFRRSLGERCVTNARVLRAFGRALGPAVDVAEVQAEQISALLAEQGPVTSAWHVKYNALAGFFRYAVSRGYTTTTPLPKVLPKRPPPFVPHIYSHEELRRLLDATEGYQRNRSLTDPVTVRTILLTLYATGLRVREVVELNREDVELENAIFTIRATKFFKSRLVPVGPELTRVLHAYASSRQSTLDPRSHVPFFTTKRGARVNQATLVQCFQRIRKHAGVRRSDGARYQPRLHDLRHAFAVHRLTSWYRQGADVQKLLPMLSVYMGHAHISATQVYLTMTPELLSEAGRRFEQYAGQAGEQCLHG
jgi:integrase/recombinase XerD